MCPLYPIHLLISYGFLLCVLWIIAGQSVVNAIESKIIKQIKLIHNNSIVDEIELNEREVQEFSFYIEDISLDAVHKLIIKEESSDGLDHLEIKPKEIIVEPIKSPDNEIKFGGTFNVTGDFLGFSKVHFVISDGNDAELMQIPLINAKIHRTIRTIDIVFIHSIIILVFIACINMGCALDTSQIWATLKRPVGPVIGLASQYLVMPLVAYGLGYLLLLPNPALWLSLFITGCAPGGGGSNMWTYLLEGNLNLSVTMTCVSTLASIAMLPLWLFALGNQIFQSNEEGNFTKVPLRNIFSLLLIFLVGCGAGVLIRKCKPRVADFLKKMLKPVALFFIIFVMTFGVYANLYMFKFLTWQVALCGFLLPFLGYSLGGISAYFLRQEWPDVKAISIETGIQNTGLAIGVLKLALKEHSPYDDVGLIVPVAVATMTPIPLSVIYIYQCIRRRFSKKEFLASPDDSRTHIYTEHKFENM